MTLTDLYNRLDWSEVDAMREKWEASNKGTYRLDDDAYRQQRLERLKLGLDALSGEADMRLWWVLPRSIRQQIKTIYETEGLLSEDANAVGA